MWQQMERVEEEVSGSNLLIKDPRLTGYLGDLIGRVGGPAARDMRIYLARIPEFNAVMFPTGFAVVFSGLLLRMRNEAQLAGVVAHESAHFLRKHQLRQWRDMRRKTDVFSILAMGAGIAGGVTGTYMGDLYQLAQLGTILSLLRYNRTLEAEADAMGVRLLAETGYDPMAMSETWEQLIGELDLSAKYRRKRRDRSFTLFETHPSPDSRMADLKISAAEVRQPGKTYDAYRDRYLTALGSIRPTLLDDQVKLNDPGASQYVVETWPRTAGTACCASTKEKSGGCATATSSGTRPVPPRVMPRQWLSRRAARRLALAWDHAAQERAQCEARQLSLDTCSWRRMRPTLRWCAR
jgi:predicted Zn-dependent protease